MPIDANLLRKHKGGNPELVAASERKRFVKENTVEKAVEIDELWRKRKYFATANATAAAAAAATIATSTSTAVQLLLRLLLLLLLLLPLLLLVMAWIVQRLTHASFFPENFRVLEARTFIRKTQHKITALRKVRELRERERERGRVMLASFQVCDNYAERETAM